MNERSKTFIEAAEMVERALSIYGPGPESNALEAAATALRGMAETPKDPTHIHSLTFHVEHHGELAAGLRPYSQTVTINFEHGEPESHRAELVDTFRDTLKDWYDGARVYTEEEYKKIYEQEAREFETAREDEPTEGRP